MKAKDYYLKLKECETKEDFETELESILLELVKDVRNLIEGRKCKTYGAIRSAVSEINNKWHALVNLYNKNEDRFGYNLTEDGFYLIFTELNPDYKQFFDKEIKRGKKAIEDAEKEAERRKQEMENIQKSINLHKVTPLDQITKENIIGEIMCCLASLGNFQHTGLPLPWAKPLAERIRFLRYWELNGINYDEIEEFEADRQKFFETHNIPL